jgi:hypothetical protein
MCSTPRTSTTISATWTVPRSRSNTAAAQPSQFPDAQPAVGADEAVDPEGRQCLGQSAATTLPPSTSPSTGGEPLSR